MPYDVLAAITSEKIVQSRLSVVVTEECVVIPSFSGQPHTVLSLDSITKIKIIKTSYPALAVISVSLFLIAAAALHSKEGFSAGAAIGGLAFAFLIAYIICQRARVVFMSGREATQSLNGSFTEVADLVAAFKISRNNLMRSEGGRLVTPGLVRRFQQWISGLLSPRIRTLTLS